MSFVRQSILAAAVSIAGAANAAPLKWTLHDVTSLGSDITGSFVYDADTGTYSVIQITTTAGTVISDGSWSILSIESMYQRSFFLQLVDTADSDQTGANTLALMFNGHLPAAGGTVDLYATYQGTCAYDTCGVFGAYPGDPTSGFNWNVTGYLTSSAVPEPASLSLLATGVGAIFLTRRRQARIAASA